MSMSTQMDLIEQTSPRLWVIRLCSWCAFALPFAFATFLLGPSPGWLDSPELIAASGSLGLSHPPGHPVYLLASHFFTLLPFGGVAFRVSLFSAMCFGLMAWLAFRAGMQLCAVVFGEDSLTWKTRWLVLLGVWLGCSQYTTLAQAVRPEVYTFHALLAFAAIERLLAALRRSRLETLDTVNWPWGVPHTTQRALLQSAFWCGLGLANHHYLMLLLFPGALLVVGSLWLRRAISGIVLRWACCLVLLGLSTYSYLPVRSLQAPPVHWGMAHTPASFSWQVTARVWQRSVQTSRVQSLSHRGMLLLTVYVEQWGFWLLISLLGLYLLLRLSWIVGGAVCLWLAAGFVGRWLMVVDRHDLDLHGYLAVSMVLVGWGIGVLAVWCSLRLLQWQRSSLSAGTLSARWQVALAKMGQGGVFLVLLLPFVLALDLLAEPDRHPFSLAHCDRRFQLGPLHWSALMEEPLPYGTILVTSYYQHGFLRWYRKVIERQRPDIVLVQRNLLVHKVISALERQRNSVLRGVEFASRDQSAAYKALKALTAQRSVCFEAGDDLPPRVVRALHPNGMFFCWIPERVVDVDPEQQAKDDNSIREQQEHFWREVYALLRPLDQPSREQTKVLLWTHYQHALLYKKTGRWRSGLHEVRLALRIDPRSTTFLQLLRFFIEQLRPSQSPS